MPRDGSHYEREAGDAQSRGYDVSDHHDKDRLPHEGIGLITSSKDTASRVLQDQNAHCTEDQSRSLRVYADALAHRPVHDIDSTSRSDSSPRTSSES